MSQVKISGNASGTGVLTIAAPNTNTDRTINIPDTAGDIVTTGDSGTISASMLDGGQTGSAPALAVRAFVSIDGDSSGSGLINNSTNVSSITDNGTGNYTVNFTTNMPSSSYAATTANSTSSVASRNIVAGSSFHTASSCLIMVETSDGDAIDTNPISVIVVA
jgi:hypothetical protein